MRELKKGKFILIPPNDNLRAEYFGDPIVGEQKSIVYKSGDMTCVCGDGNMILVNTENGSISIENRKYADIVTTKKLYELQSKLSIRHGDFNAETSEQKMCVRYLGGDEKVLEIGGNIGRTSLIISSILKNPQNHLVLESDPQSFQALIENRKINNMCFHLENAALSKRALIQKVWDTIPSDVLLDGYFSVNTITWEHLKQKYRIEFDTLVLDCEGAFFYILLDMPEILDNIKLICMENDYHNYDHKLYVDKVLLEKGFSRIYSEKFGWGQCINFFYEVWNR